MRMRKNDLTLVILAGGEGTRMNLTGKITPKPLLSAYDEPLLLRQVRQIEEAGISNIVISTNPNDYLLIKSILKKEGLYIEVIKNSEHAKGSLPALMYILNKMSTPKILMSFADIYFLENPFYQFINVDKNDYLIGISKPFDIKELSLGGIVFIGKNHLVDKITEESLENNKKGYKWNGLSLFKTKNKDKLNEFLSIYSNNSPEGNFFEYMRTKHGVKFASVTCPDFINVNRPENLLTASLYRYSELQDNNIMSVAKQIRRHTLKGS